MMNTINPSHDEINAAMNLLSVLELAKDATKLKAALGEIKEAQDAAAEEKKAAQEAIAEAKAKAQELDKIAAQLDAERARLKDEAKKISTNNENIDLSLAAMKDERNKFDRWMADQRETLAADKAKVESDSVANRRRAEDLQALEEAAAQRVREAEAAEKSADAKRAEYEAKIQNLKAMVG